MKAVVIEAYGDKDQLVEKQGEVPEINADQVLVEVHATSINPIDWKLREGYLKEMLDFDFPITLGWDVAGVVAETGAIVTKFKEGDRVFARPELTRFGTYAEYAPVDEDLLAHLPDSIPFEEGAAVPLAGLTARQCLVDVGNVAEGDRVLIHAGSGGVGSFAIQIAKARGAYVAATASGENEVWVKALGVDRFINYEMENFHKALEGFDFVLDTLGGEVQENSYQVLKQGGTLASIVQKPNEDKAAEYGVTAASVWLQPDGENLAELAELMNKGMLTAVVGHRYDFSQTGLRDAHAASESHHAKGKIVIPIHS
ncbi:NADP-dependent oxidoreductase [Thalassobacillus sp. CUG 92003]|uniref:NADP-dependent oxidoreductase n=1 Tax=Thalassobacillus sp. CUG 92003 TaxID=2736641 RepID=UPI0015E6592E|nr:NADP-dependent oxidoreductase [Thalassobacillus sp. CUG 92003]